MIFKKKFNKKKKYLMNKVTILNLENKLINKNIQENILRKISL